MGLPTTDEIIDEAAKECGIRVPYWLRNEWRRSNGGQILEFANDSWTLHPVRDMSNRKTIKRSSNHIQYETLQAKSWHGFPENFVNIAANGSGDLLVMKPDSEDIFIWWHETHEIQHIAKPADA